VVHLLTVFVEYRVHVAVYRVGWSCAHRGRGLTTMNKGRTGILKAGRSSETLFQKQGENREAFCHHVPGSEQEPVRDRACPLGW
jgi:hypothetical protein